MFRYSLFSFALLLSCSAFAVPTTVHPTDTITVAAYWLQSSQPLSLTDKGAELFLDEPPEATQAARVARRAASGTAGVAA